MQNFIANMQGNPVVSTIIGMYGIGVLTYLLRGVPRGIKNFLKRHFTTKITITTHNSNIFYKTSKFFEEKAKKKNFRTIKLINGRYGYSNKTTKTIGYGFHFFWHNRTLFLVDFYKDDNNKTEYDKDVIEIITIGRSHRKINNLIEEIEHIDKNRERNEITLFKNNEYWSYVNKMKKRSLDTIFIPNKTKETLLNTLDNFINKEEWYKENGIPYQLGILLYGEPGTGKSSLIKAIASYLNYDIYYLDTTDIKNIENAIATLPEKVLFVIEDIDANKATHTREEGGESPLSGLFGNDLDMSALSSILNALDGLMASHGRVLVTTTNHIEKLDSALLRPGRIDLRLEISVIDDESFKMFCDKFGIENDNLKVNRRMSMAELQGLVLSGLSNEDIVKYVCDEEDEEEVEYDME